LLISNELNESKRSFEGIKSFRLLGTWKKENKHKGRRKPLEKSQAQQFREPEQQTTGVGEQREQSEQGAERWEGAGGLVWSATRSTATNKQTSGEGSTRC
jgi:hypothetical protein